MSDIVQKLWGFCHTLRHDGVDYGDYIEQLTYLLFLKMTDQHFAEFIDAYGKDPNGLTKRKDTGEAGRFRKFHLSEIKARGYKLDITWLKDDSLEDSDELPEPQDLASEAITELGAVVDDLREIVALVEKEEAVEK